jgi:hypothetical protein
MHAPAPPTAPILAAALPRPGDASETKDFATIHAAMVERLRDVTAPRIAVFPMPSQFEDVRDYIAAVSRIMDAWLFRVGMEVKSNTNGLDMGVFTDQFRGATEGNCEYECTMAAERRREEFYEERRR